MTLPTFLVVGAMRAGTTSLYRHLRGHPEIFMPENKEPSFFAYNWDRGLDWYERLFRDSKAIARGEASTAYSHARTYPGVPERIAGILPDAKFVYLIRHPIERLISQWHFMATREQGRHPIDRAFRNEVFLSRSMYAFQIERYLTCFERERLLVLTTEDLRDRPDEILRTVYGFLGVDPNWVPPEAGRPVHRGKDLRRFVAPVAPLSNSALRRIGRRLVPPSLRRQLSALLTRPAPVDRESLVPSEEALAYALERLRPDLVRLRLLLGNDFHCWGLIDQPPESVS